MKLNGIVIGGKEVLHENFSFKGVWQAIEPSQAPYRETLKMLRKTMEDFQISRLLDYLEEKGTCPSETAELLEAGRVREASLEEWLKSLRQEQFWQENQESIRQLIQMEEYHFSRRACALLCLFLLLHIQAGRGIGEMPEDLEISGGNWELEELNHNTALGFMKKRLLRESLLENNPGEHWGEISITQEMPELSLPFWKGIERSGEPLELVKLINKGTRPVLVSLEGTSLVRQLFPEEWIYAIRSGQLYVDFLPRFTVSEELCLMLQGGRLTAYEKEGMGEAVSMRFPEEPAVWSYDEALGLFVAGGQGGFFSRSLEAVENPAKRVVQVSLFSHFYGILSEDGALVTNFREAEGWQDLLEFSAGLNNAAGIRRDRNLVLARGCVPMAEGGTRAVSVRVFEDHLIWLDTRGAVHTEQRGGRAWKSFPGASAVEICRKGYVIAWERGIYLIPFTAREEKGEEEAPLVRAETNILEMAMSDMLLAYRTLEERQVHMISVSP